MRRLGAAINDRTARPSTSRGFPAPRRQKATLTSPYNHDGNSSCRCWLRNHPTPTATLASTYVKTPNDTKEVAGLIQSFLRERGITVARCDALELASRLKGRRDLHEDQATSAPVQSAGDDDANTIQPAVFASYLNALVFILKRNCSFDEAFAVVNEMPFPAPALSLGRFLGEQYATGIKFADACRAAQLPKPYLSLLYTIASNAKFSWEEIEPVAKFILELSNVSLPPIVFRSAPPFAASHIMQAILTADPDPVPDTSPESVPSPA